MRISRTQRPTIGPGTTAVRPADSARAVRTGGREVTDVAQIMGIPVAELSSKAQEAISRLMAELNTLHETVTAQRNRISKLEELADQDSMTPVANRRAFVRELARLTSFSRRYGEASSVIYFDVNGLKDINDTFGHAAGDAAILKVADLLLENVRDSDLVARLGGDEFGVLLTHASEDTAVGKARILRERIEAQPLDWEGERIPLRLAFGVHRLTNGENAGDALAAADRAMYADKRGS